MAFTVSVVIPCYNGASFLRETIDSVLNQTHPALEVIVVDDGSTDDSAAIAASYGPPVRVIRQKNQGQSAARNRGMDEAQGEWVGLLDADDRWVPNKLERQFDALRDAPEDTACIYSDFVLFGSVRRQVVSCPMWPDESERRVRMLTAPWICQSCAVILTSIGRTVRFPADIRYGVECVFWFRFAEYGSFVHVPEPLFEYRKHPQQMTSQSIHVCRVLASLWSWVEQNPNALTATETQLLRRLVAELVVHDHDLAFWRNDLGGVERARALYHDVAPESGPLPPLFERALPTWTMRVESRVWDVIRTMLPSQFQQALRPLVDRLKRGRAVRR